MWFRDCRAAFVLTLMGSMAALAEAGPDTAGGGPPAPSECRDLDGKILAPMDCAEYLQALELLGKTEDARLKILETRKRRTEIERPVSPPAPPQPASPAPAAAALLPAVPDRVLEVFGGQARLRYRGAVLLVQAGSPLPGGGRVAAVSLDGVEISEGRERRRIPVLLGDSR